MITYDYEKDRKKIKLDVIGIDENNNLIVSRKSYEEYQQKVEKELAFYKHKLRVMARQEKENS